MIIVGSSVHIVSYHMWPLPLARMGVSDAAAVLTIDIISSTEVGCKIEETLLHAGEPSPSKVLYTRAFEKEVNSPRTAKKEER